MIFKRTVAALVVFGTVFAVFAAIGIVFRLLDGLFWPVLVVAIVVALLFFILDTISGWVSPA